MRKITIDGDFSPLLKGFRKTTKELEKMSKKGFSLKIDDKDFKNFSKFSMDTFTKLEKLSKQYEGSLKRLNNIRKKGVELTQKQVREERKLQAHLKNVQSGISSQRGHFGAGNLLQRGGARVGAMGFRGAGAMGGVLQGLGGAARMMGPVGMVAGGAAAAYMGARALAAPRRRLAGLNLTFRGLRRGATSQDELEDIRQSGNRFGFGATETMESANMLQRNIGDIRSAEDMEQFARARRGTGLDPDTLATITGAFRAAAVDQGGAKLGGDEGTLKKTMKLYQQAMVSALDTSGAIKFLQVSAEMTEQIANEGTADAKAISDTLTSLSQASDFYKANVARGTAAFKGAETFFKSKEGTGLAIRAMTGEKMSGSPAELLFKQQLGFMQGAVDIGGETFQGMGAKGLGAIIRELGFEVTGKTNLKSMGRDEKAMAALTLSQQFGISASNAGKLLEAGMSGKLGEISKEKLDELLTPEGKQHDKKMASLMGSVDKTIKSNEASLEEMVLDIGDGLIPIMTSMEEGIWKMVQEFTGAEKSTQQLRDEALVAKDKAAEEKRDSSISRFIGQGLGYNPEQDAKKAADAALGRRLLSGGGDISAAQTGAMVEEAQASVLGSLHPRYHSVKTTTARRNLKSAKLSLQGLQENISQRTQIHGPFTEEQEKKKDLELRDEREAVGKFTAIVEALERMLGNQPVKPINHK